MFNCDIMFKVKAKMRHKIKRLPLLSLFLALASPAIAGEATSVCFPTRLSMIARFRHGL